MTIGDMDTSAPGALHLPRQQAGSAPQHLLITLLGDFWYKEATPIPSRALVALMEEFDVPEAATRAALSRLARRGLLDTYRDGRTTRYELTTETHRILVEGLTRIERFTQKADSWDGEWTLAAFSISEQRRELRSALRTRLRWLGFAPLLDAQWVSPRAQPEDVVEAFREFAVRTGSVFRGRWDPQSPLAPVDAWDVDEIRNAYDAFIDGFQSLSDELRLGRIDAATSLIERTRVMDEWRRMPGIDPALPQEVLAGDWPGERARNLFTSLYNGLGDLAALRARSVIAAFDQATADRVRHHTIRELR